MVSFDLLNRRKRDFKSVFLNTDEGERVLAQIYKMCGENQQIHAPNDPYTTAFNAGKHRVAQGIKSILNQTDDDIARIINQGASQGLSSTFDPYNQNQ